MKTSKLRTGKEVYDILKPLYSVASPQIRQHFLEPGLILVISGAHPATKIIIQNPSQEIFHEIRTLNLLLKKSKIRFRISTKYLRKEVNNLQRQASIIIESIHGYERLSSNAFSKENALHAVKGFADVERWRNERIAKDKNTQKPLLDAIEEGEITFSHLSLIEELEKDKIINDFLSLNVNIQKDKFFNEEKFFNLLERINIPNLPNDHNFEDLVRDIKIVLKNSHLLTLGLNQDEISGTIVETLNEMLISKYSLIRNVAEKTLKENSQRIRQKLNYADNFSTHELEKKIYHHALKRLESMEKTF